MKCPLCGAKMYKEDGEWHCTKCWSSFFKNPFTGELKLDMEDFNYYGPDKEEPDEMEWSDL